MVITKQEAKNIAREMSKKRLKAVIELRNIYSDFVRSEYIKTVPSQILVDYRYEPKYFQSTCKILLSGLGFSHEVVDIKESVVNNSGNYYAVMDMREAFSVQAMKLKRNYEAESTRYKATFEQLENALNSLHTDKKIAEHLPEAVPFLPSKTITAVAINLDSLRKQLQPI